MKDTTSVKDKVKIIVKKKQKAFSFDRESMTKIFKGAVIAMTGSAAIAFFNYIGTIEISDHRLALVIAWIVPTGMNLVKEFIKGE